MRVLHVRAVIAVTGAQRSPRSCAEFRLHDYQARSTLKNLRPPGPSVMARMMGRLLIVDGQRDFACLVGAIAERLGFATRILPHTLDFDYVMQHWHPDVVALQVAMADQQDLEVLKYLEQSRFRGRLVLTADVNKGDFERAVKEARENGLTVTSVLTRSSPYDHIEAALKLLLDLEHAA